MSIDKNNRVSLRWELNPFFIQILQTKICIALSTDMATLIVTWLQTKNTS